jgi:enoyl-CoA hydratase
MKSVLTEAHGDVFVVTINRPEVRNAVDGRTARTLAEVFRGFDADSSMRVAVLTGAAGTFCAGADLKALAVGQGNTLSEVGDGPMGPTRMLLSKVTQLREAWSWLAGAT